MNESTERNIDFGTVLRSLKRQLPWLVTVPLLAAGLVYFWSASQPPVYTATMSLMASNPVAQSADSVLGSALVTAPPLPEGAISEALHSDAVLLPLMQAVRASDRITPVERERVTQELTEDLRNRRLETITLVSRVEQFSNGNGIHSLTVRAGDPKSAAAIANMAGQALLDWDRNRALENIKRAEAGFRAQLEQVDEQLASAGSSGLDRETLLASRTSIVRNLSNVSILENSAVGILRPLSSAVEPLRPVAPRPLRNAALAWLTAALLLALYNVFSVLLDRTIRSEDDLAPLNLPGLAFIPKVAQRDVEMRGIINTARQEGLYEALGFLRVNLLSALKGLAHPTVMVSSTTPGEGKSTVSATLADGLASSGQRVLLVDADLRRGTQEKIWRRASPEAEWVQLTGQGGARTTQEALSTPEDVQVLRIGPSLDLLPAGQGLHDTLAILSESDLSRALDLWKVHYDVVIVDSAPLLALADGLIVGAHVDGVVIISEYGKTHFRALRAALERARRRNLNILGVVINKFDTRGRNSYQYSYKYSSMD
ncbi:AAA family ATPase [Deinococcus lacus]|uniref:AAA family ATPase n=1 Tax=Deinococcus lacus TaxID=392561 RepID=A0ABW1YGS4_9DEIO